MIDDVHKVDAVSFSFGVVDVDALGAEGVEAVHGVIFYARGNRD